MVSHIRMGSTIKRCVHQLPHLELEASIQPITRTVLRVRLDIKPEFKWDEKVLLLSVSQMVEGVGWGWGGGAVFGVPVG